MFGMSRLIVVLILASATLGQAAPLPKPDPEKIRKELDTAWEALLSEDEQTAGRALLCFASHKEDAVDYIKSKLKPLKLTKERACQLLADLVSGDDQVSKAAFEEFKYFDPRLVLDDKQLREALLDKPARRLGAVLCDLPMDTLTGEKWHWYSPDNKMYRFNCGEAVSDRDAAITVGLIGKVGRKATWVRAIRAVTVLEFVGTPKAREILDDISTGHPNAAPTKAAKAAIDRLKK